MIFEFDKSIFLCYYIFIIQPANVSNWGKIFLGLNFLMLKQHKFGKNTKNCLANIIDY